MNNLAIGSTVQSEKSGMPNLVRRSADEVNNSINNDFISHPQQYPLEIKRLRRWSLTNWPWSKSESPLRSAKLATLDSKTAAKSKRATVGLSVHSSQYFETNTQVQVSIPLRGEAQSFTGTVVLVRELSDGFEIGLWLASDEDEARARIVEKICHTECGLGKKARGVKAVESTLISDLGGQSANLPAWLQLHSNKPLVEH